MEKNIKEKNGPLNTYHPRSMDIELTQITSKQPLLGSTRHTSRRDTENYHYSTGHLIPLSCGHNGILEVYEVEIYEQFLKNANLT